MRRTLRHFGVICVLHFCFAKACSLRYFPHSGLLVTSGNVQRQGSDFIVDVLAQNGNGAVIPAFMAYAQKFPISVSSAGTYTFSVRANASIVARSSFAVAPGWRGEQLVQPTLPNASPLRAFDSPLANRPWQLTFSVEKVER